MRRKNTTTEMLKDYISQSLLIIMREKSFTEITIEEIVNKAGVNRCTYYRHFNSKEDIIRFYYRKIMFEYIGVFDKRLSFENIHKNLLQHYLKYKKELLLIYKNNLSYLIFDELNNSFKSMIKEKSIPVEEHYKIYWYTGAIYNTVLLWLSNDMKETPDELSRIYNSIVSNTDDRDFMTKPFIFNR